MKRKRRKPVSQNVPTIVMLSANLGSFDPEVPWAEQEVPPGFTLTVKRYNDKNFPPRDKAMTSRLQPGIVKMFGWELHPGHDVYVWVDASRTITSPGFLLWMLGELGDADMAIFKHPERRSIREEYEFVKSRLANGDPYLVSRYGGEWLDAQYEVILLDGRFNDDRLYASTSFIYRPKASVRAAMKEWWHHKTRYLLHDQLALPYVLWKNKVRVNTIDSGIYKMPYWEVTRKRR